MLPTTYHLPPPSSYHLPPTTVVLLPPPSSYRLPIVLPFSYLSPGSKMTTELGVIRDFVSPPGFTRKDYVARGTNGRVFLDATSHTIVKITNGYDQDDQAAIIVERKIYERLQSQRGHHGILRYYGPYASGLRLEYASNRNVANEGQFYSLSSHSRSHHSTN
jgi:hypothetical protein